MDILTQSLAIQKSLASLNKLVLSNHLQTHIKDKFSSNQEIAQEEAIKELLELYQLSHVKGASND